VSEVDDKVPFLPIELLLLSRSSSQRIVIASGSSIDGSYKSNMWGIESAAIAVTTTTTTTTTNNNNNNNNNEKKGASL
jgi:hypothetical protein